MRFFRKGGAGDNPRPRESVPAAGGDTHGGHTRDADMPDVETAGADVEPAGGESATRTSALREGIHLPETEDDLRQDASGTRRR